MTRTKKIKVNELKKVIILEKISVYIMMNLIMRMMIIVNACSWLKDETNSTNFERCMKENASEVGNNTKGAIVTFFHYREENYQIINSGCSNHRRKEKGGLS